MRVTWLCCGFFFLNILTLEGEETTRAGDLRFQYPPEDAFIRSEIEGFDSEGNVTVRVLKRQRIALVEGYYIGLVYKEDAGFVQEVLLRARVEEVLEDNRAQVMIDRSAIGHLKTKSLLSLFRPIGSATKTIDRVPAAAPLAWEFEPAPIEGMAMEQLQKLHESSQHLKAIGAAIHRFHDPWNRYPPAVLIGPDGKPWHSWRVLILPYLKEKDLYKNLYESYRFDEPWDGPNNKNLIAEMPEEFHDPVHGAKSEKGYTSYVAVVGPDAGFVKAKFSGKAESLGYALQEGRAFRDFLDGASKTVMIGSVSPDLEIPWTKPEDFELGEQIPSIGGERGFAALYEAKAGRAGVFLFADGSVTTIRTDIETQHWRNLLQRNDRQSVDLPPSFDEAARNAERIRVLEYRTTDAGPQAVLRMVPKEK